MLKERIFFPIFFILLILALLPHILGELPLMRYIASSSILFLLLFQVITTKNLKPRTRRFTILALLFSVITILSFINLEYQSYFYIALFSYALQLIMFTVVFYHNKPFEHKQVLILSILLMFFGLILINLIFDRLGDYFPFVLFFIIILVSMIQTSFLRRGHVSKKSFCLGFIGTIFILISSSSVAINVFYLEETRIEIVISIFYNVGLLMIVESIIKEKSNYVKHTN